MKICKRKKKYLAFFNVLFKNYEILRKFVKNKK